MKLLHIDSSILGEGSVSRSLSAEVVATLRASQPGVEVTYRDLAYEPLGHLTAVHLGALQGAPVDPALLGDVTDGKVALDDFLAADIVVVGAPMYNFGIPSQLKAWIDRVAIAGKTFRYTENGPQGLAGGKKLIVVSSRGGVFSAGTPTAAFDFQETYLRTLFGFLGVTDITFVRAEGVAMGPEARTRAIEAARAEATKLAA
ncbi:MAG: FMN-dependent NADH-azoreductase [Xanthobacteraceae bacterium]|jgi:FMN-dependent NADH-azoreductase